MPSPIAHSCLVLVARALTERHGGLRCVLDGRSVFFYITVVATLCAPDIDFLVRALSDHPSLVHGGATHSLCVGVLFGCLFAVVCRIRYGPELPVAPVLGIGIGCAWAHALMDIATWGSGAMLLWPFSGEKYTTLPLFFGARHSQPTAWNLHLITLTTELLFVVLVWRLTRGSCRAQQARNDAVPPQGSGPARAVSQ